MKARTATLLAALAAFSTATAAQACDAPKHKTAAHIARTRTRLVPVAVPVEAPPPRAMLVRAAYVRPVAVEETTIDVVASRRHEISAETAVAIARRHGLMRVKSVAHDGGHWSVAGRAWNGRDFDADIYGDGHIKHLSIG